MSWISEPIKASTETRCRLAWIQILIATVGWPGTHALMALTNPPENSWVFHVLLAISWWAIVSTAYDTLVSTHAGAHAEAATGDNSE